MEVVYGAVCFLIAMTLALIATSTHASAERVWGDVNACRRLARNLLPPPPPPPHFLHVVTCCKSRTYTTLLNTAYPIATIGYKVVFRCLNCYPLKQLSIYCANYRCTYRMERKIALFNKPAIYDLNTVVRLLDEKKLTLRCSIMKRKYF